MGNEIERKFLVIGDDYKSAAKRHFIRQGYLCTDPERVVRIRIEDECGFITVKGKGGGISRPEYEYVIPIDDAEELLDNLCYRPQIEKYRYVLNEQGFIWEIDEFLGENEGLIVAEIELKSENVAFSKPGWVGKEVTHDPRYLNANLTKRPFKNWKDE